MVREDFSEIDPLFAHYFSFQFRNQYDSDVTVWSPQGRIYQIEYAMEAVKQGSATVGIKSKTHAVLVALKVKMINQSIKPEITF